MASSTRSTTTSARTWCTTSSRRHAQQGLRAGCAEAASGAEAGRAALAAAPGCVGPCSCPALSHAAAGLALRPPSSSAHSHLPSLPSPPTSLPPPPLQIPHYHLEKATEAVKPVMGEYYREPEPSPGLFPTHLWEPLRRSFGRDHYGERRGRAGWPAGRAQPPAPAGCRAGAVAVPWLGVAPCGHGPMLTPPTHPPNPRPRPPLLAPVDDSGDIVFYKKDDNLKLKL